MNSAAIDPCSSIMPAILPYESDLLPGYKEFYRKWSAWAKANFDYVKYTEPFGEQVQPGAVDGYARIKGHHGFVFLFNGNPRPSEDEIRKALDGNRCRCTGYVSIIRAVQKAAGNAKARRRKAGGTMGRAENG